MYRSGIWKVLKASEHYSFWLEIPVSGLLLNMTFVSVLIMADLVGFFNLQKA